MADTERPRRHLAVAKDNTTNLHTLDVQCTVRQAHLNPNRHGQVLVNTESRHLYVVKTAITV